MRASDEGIHDRRAQWRCPVAEALEQAARIINSRFGPFTSSCWACVLFCSRCSDSFPSRGPGRGTWLKFGKVASGLRVVIRAAVTNQCRGQNPARRDDAGCLQDEVRPVRRCGSRRALEQAPTPLQFSCKSTGDVVKNSQDRPQKATRSG
jgi:hypothetical protein